MTAIPGSIHAPGRAITKDGFLKWGNRGPSSFSYPQPTRVTHPMGVVFADGPALLWKGSITATLASPDATMNFSTTRYTTFTIPSVGGHYFCKEQDWATVATSLDVIGLTYQVTWGWKTWQNRNINPFPSCSGIDPAHQCRFQLIFNSSGTITGIHITAGMTSGGPPITVAAQDVPIPGGVAGTFTLSANLGGIVVANTGSMPVPGLVLLATVILVGHDNTFHSQDVSAISGFGTNTFFWDGAGFPFGTGSSPVPNFPASDPVILPTPASIPSSHFNSVLVPPGTYSGFYGLNSSNNHLYAFSVDQFPTLSNAPAWANPLTVVFLQAGVNTSDGIGFSTSAPFCLLQTPGAGFSTDFIDTGILIPIITLSTSSSPTVITTLGNTTYEGRGPGYSTFAIGSLAVLYPSITCTPNISTCP